LIIETDAFQQPSGIWVDRNPGSDLPENLGLLEYGCIETSRPERERSGQTSDTAADNCDAKRAKHYSQTLAVNRNHGPCDAAERLRFIRGNAWPMRQKELARPAMTCRRTIRYQPNTTTDEPSMTLLMAAASSQSLGPSIRKHRAQSPGISSCL
jgi:hypothetical protein